LNSHPSSIRFRAAVSAILIAVLTTAFAVAAKPAHSADVQVAASKVAKQLTNDGGWSFFGDPRAVAANGKIYTGWTTRTSLTTIQQIDEDTGKTNSVILGPRLGPLDDHNNPSLVVRPDGHIVAFYAPHSGRIQRGNKPSHLYYRVTIKAGDISKWTGIRSVPTNTAGSLGYTYPNPLKLSGNRIWVAWRGGNWFPTYSIMRGNRWQPARTLIYNPSKRGKPRPYAKYAEGKNGSILIGYNENNPAQTNTNMYFARLKPGKGFYRASGRLLVSGAGPLSARRGDIVQANSIYGRSWVMDVAEDSEGRPVVVYAVGNRGHEMAYFYARYQKGRWQRTRMVGMGYNNGPESPDAYGYYATAGAALDHKDPSKVYVSRAVGPTRQMVVETWSLQDKESANGGWTVARNSPADQNCFRPSGIHGGEAGTVIMMCGEYKNWYTFTTGIWLYRPAN
jgi:hypothetical protein